MSALSKVTDALTPGKRRKLEHQAEVASAGESVQNAQKELEAADARIATQRGVIEAAKDAQLGIVANGLDAVAFDEADAAVLAAEKVLRRLHLERQVASTRLDEAKAELYRVTERDRIKDGTRKLAVWREVMVELGSDAVKFQATWRRAQVAAGKMTFLFPPGQTPPTEMLSPGELRAALRHELFRLNYEERGEKLMALPGAAEHYSGDYFKALPSLADRVEQTVKIVIAALERGPAPSAPVVQPAPQMPAAPAAVVTTAPQAPRPAGEPGPNASAAEVNAYRRAQDEAAYLARVKSNTSK